LGKIQVKRGERKEGEREGEGELVAVLGSPRYVLTGKKGMVSHILT
jgi:hypothetical protein